MINSRVIPVIILSVFASMLGVGIIAPFLPLYAESMGATGIWVGIIFGAYSASRAVFMPLVGRLSDKRGRKPFLVIGLFAYTLISLAYVWAETPQTLTAVRLLHGVAGAMIIPIAQAYIGDLAPSDKVGSYMGYFNMSLFAGFGFGPIMGGLINDYFGMNTSFYAMGALCLLAFMLALILLPYVEPHRKSGTVKPRLSVMFKNKGIRALFSFRLGLALGRGTHATFLPIFGGLSLGLSASQIGVVIGLSALTSSLLQPVFGRLSDKYNRRKLVALGNAADLIYLLSIPFMGNFYQLMAVSLTLSMGRALCLPAASAMSVEQGEKFGMGSTMGLFSMAMSIGVAIGPILGGVFMDWGGLNTPFYFAAAMEALGIGLFLWYTR